MQTNIEQTLKPDKTISVNLSICEPWTFTLSVIHFSINAALPRTCLEKIELNPRNQLLFELLFVIFILVVLQSEGINLNFKPTSLIKVAFQKPAGILEGYSSKAGIFHPEYGFSKS